MQGVRFWLKSYFDRDAAWNDVIYYGLNMAPPNFWEQFMEKWGPILRQQEKEREAASQNGH